MPRVYFWLFHLLWLFPWSVYFPAVAKLSFKPVDRASRTRLLALCWTGFMLVFFTFSTTQEYYTMPCYPALALLLGSAMAAGGGWSAARYARDLQLPLDAPPWRLSRFWCWCGMCPRRAISPRRFRSVLALTRFRSAIWKILRWRRSPICALPLAIAARRVPGRRGWERCAVDRAARVRGCGGDDGSVLPGRAAGHGGIRPVSVVAAAGGGAAAFSRRQADCGPSLLHVLVHLFLHEPLRTYC